MNQNYIIKTSRETLERIIAVIDEKNINHTTISNDEMQLNIENEQEFEFMVKTLAISIALDFFIDSVTKYGTEKEWNPEDISEYIKSETKPFPPYYSLLTEIHLRESFKKSNNLNINAFRKFNLRGFEEEVNSLLNLYDEMMERDSDVDKLLKEYYGDDATIDDFGKDVAESFATLEDAVYSIEDVKREDFESVRVVCNDISGYKAVTNAGIELTSEYFMEKLKMQIVISAESGVEQSKFIELLAILNFTLSIFKTLKFEIDLSINIEEYNSIFDNLNMQSELLELKPKIEYKLYDK